MSTTEKSRETVLHKFFRKLMEELLNKFSSEAIEMDLSLQEHYIIEILGRNEKMTISNLAEKVSAPLTTISSTLDRLYEQNYVERERSQEDRRVVEVSLSKKGQKCFDVHQEETEELIDQFLSQLSEDDKVEMQRILSSFEWEDHAGEE